MEVERRKNIYLSKENAESPILQGIMQQSRFSPLINELLSNYLSTGLVGENSVVASLEEEIRHLNSVIETLTALLEKTYRASVYSAGVAYENSDPEICNRVADKTQSAYMDIIEGNLYDTDEFFMRPKSVSRLGRNRDASARDYTESQMYSRRQADEYYGGGIETPRPSVNRTASERVPAERSAAEMNNTPREMTQEEIARRRFVMRQREELRQDTPAELPKEEATKPDKQPDVIHASLADMIKLGKPQ